jgi:uncharacterized membrane protein
MGQDLGKTSTGIQANVAALLCYLVGFISGIIFFLIEKDNKFVRFHAMQSIITFGAFFVLQMVLIPFAIFLMPIVSVGSIILWIVLMIKAYQGETFKLPIIGDIAEKKFNKFQGYPSRPSIRKTD